MWSPLYFRERKTAEAAEGIVPGVRDVDDSGNAWEVFGSQRGAVYCQFKPAESSSSEDKVAYWVPITPIATTETTLTVGGYSYTLKVDLLSTSDDDLFYKSWKYLWGRKDENTVLEQELRRLGDYSRKNLIAHANIQFYLGAATVAGHHYSFSISQAYIFAKDNEGVFRTIEFNEEATRIQIPRSQKVDSLEKALGIFTRSVLLLISRIIISSLIAKAIIT